MNKKLLIIIGSAVFCLIVLILLFQILLNFNRSKNVPIVKTGATSAPEATKGNETRISGETGTKELIDTIVTYPDSPKAESAFFELAARYEKSGELLKAREAYQKIVEKFPSSSDIAKAMTALGNVNIKIISSPMITEGTLSYEIQKGDTLAKIARRFNATTDLISRINNLQSSNIKFGRKLKIPNRKFSVVVDKSQNILALKADGEIVKTYQVSTGLNNSTPAGNFTITTKVIDPVWYTAGAVVPAESPKNILGTRWLGLSKQGYGIHGTTEPGNIGKSVTAGCVRMINSDVEELYSIVPERIEVVIVD